MHLCEGVGLVGDAQVWMYSGMFHPNCYGFFTPPQKKKRICQHGSNFLHQGDLSALVNTALIGPMDTQIRFTRKMSVLLVFIKWIYQLLQTLNTLQSILGCIRPCLLENACILYLTVYNFTSFRWAENCTPQDQSLQTLNTLQSILGCIRPCLLENACILYLTVYNFTQL